MGTYLDYNAMAPMRRSALNAMNNAYEQVGNPSSVHGFGRIAKQALEKARQQVAQAIKSSPDDLVFTSGGTESNNLAIKNAVDVLGVRKILLSPCEHPSNLIAAEQSGADIIYLPMLADGLIDITLFEQVVLQQKEPFMAVVMLANNETGIIQPLRRIADIVHENDGFLHVDAAQAFGKIPVSFGQISADTMTLAAHKVGGPIGVGALVVRCGLSLRGQMLGGGQESGRRGGTSNVPAITGFAVAANEAVSELAEFAALYGKIDTLAEMMRKFSPDLVVFGEDVDCLPNTLCCAATGFSSQTQVMALDLSGFAISAGSACSSGKVKSSHVLKAMNVPDNLAKCAVRISIGRDITDQQLKLFANAWGLAYEQATRGEVA
ncbi:MAG: cysteine desulfurase [Robiginitomaculum sp.]|nr:cysteine desulfurase [Robiginitomaculum sp.]